MNNKGFARADDEGFVDKIQVTPANAGGSPEFGTMIDGATAQRVMADKAYASKANREALRGKHRDCILRKAARGLPLRTSEKRFNRLISKRRFRAEQVFCTMKRLFGLHRARYFGVAKTHARMAMAAISQNLLKAANKITLTQPNTKIAQPKTVKHDPHLPWKRGGRTQPDGSYAPKRPITQRYFTGIEIYLASECGSKYRRRGPRCISACFFLNRNLFATAAAKAG